MSTHSSKPITSGSTKGVPLIKSKEYTGSKFLISEAKKPQKKGLNTTTQLLTDRRPMRLGPTESIFKVVKDFSMLPKKPLQDKIDFFITPYNKGIALRRHMEFEDKKKRSTSVEWKVMADFILNENISVFRKS